jgi:hypothetical protein
LVEGEPAPLSPLARGSPGRSLLGSLLRSGGSAAVSCCFVHHAGRCRFVQEPEGFGEALEQVARLVDVVELPAGTVELDRRELVVTLDSVRALVVGRRALPALLEMAPDLVTERQEEVAWRAGSEARALRLHPA